MQAVVHLLNGLSILVLALALLSVADVLPASEAHRLFARQDPNAAPPATREQQDAVVALASNDPVGAARMAVTLPYLSGPGAVATGSLPTYALVQGDDVQQLPWNTNAPLTTVPAVNGSDEGGWQALPELDGFTLNRTFAIRGEAVMPFYISSGYDATQIRRAVMIMPGKPRDCWKYTALLRSSLNIIAMQAQPGATNASVLLLGLCWFNEADKNAGAVRENELYWTRSGWAKGSMSVGPPVPLTQDEYDSKLRKLNRTLQAQAHRAIPGAEPLAKRQVAVTENPAADGARAAPGSSAQSSAGSSSDHQSPAASVAVRDLALPPEETKTNVSSYEVLDRILDFLFDKATFPNLNRVVLAGHSMGGQGVQRYAMLKKTKAYDPNLMFWIGNPGAYAFPVTDRPYQIDNCPLYEAWPYGLTNVSSIPRYARRDVNASLPAVVARYRQRDIHYALGLLDNGQGDTHCQATMQGYNHLERGCQFVFAIANTSDAGLNRTTSDPSTQLSFPSTKQTVDFVANTSHQDYPMLSTNVTLWRLFNDRFDTADPPLTNVTNPGDPVARTRRPKAPPHEKKVKKFVTPLGQRLATIMLYGSVGSVSVAYLFLYFFFRASSKEQRWQRELDAATTLARPAPSASEPGDRRRGGEGLLSSGGTYPSSYGYPLAPSPSPPLQHGETDRLNDCNSMSTHASHSPLVSELKPRNRLSRNSGSSLFSFGWTARAQPLGSLNESGASQTGQDTGAERGRAVTTAKRHTREYSAGLEASTLSSYSSSFGRFAHSSAIGYDSEKMAR